jgi:multidrug resistance protein
MVIPNMPDYIESLGGGRFKGYHISLFALMALISRPFSGTLTDKVGRVPILAFGALICAIMGFGYLVALSFWMVLLLRFLHGLSTGFTPTGATAYVADLAPKEKRGLAMGFAGMSNNLGMAIGPIIGGYIFNVAGFDWIFIVSSILGLIAFFIFKSLPETAAQTNRFKMSNLKIKLSDFYEPKVYGPFIVVFAASFAFGAFLTIIPEHSKELNILNLGVAFTIMTVSSVITRLYASYLSDIYGRVWVLRISLSLMAIVILAMTQIEGSLSLCVLSALWGLCQGAASPTIFAWTTDKASEEFKGRAYATVFIGLETGIILGGYFTGLSQSLKAGIPSVYIFTSIIVGLSAVFVWFTKIDFSKKDLK